MFQSRKKQVIRRKCSQVLIISLCRLNYCFSEHKIFQIKYSQLANFQLSSKTKLRQNFIHLYQLGEEKFVTISALPHGEWERRGEGGGVGVLGAFPIGSSIV